MGYTLITGACGGLGKAFCRELIKTDDLFLTGRSAERLNELKAELCFVNPQANVMVFQADLTSEKERENLFSFADENDITFSGYFAVAGADIQKAFMKYTPEKIVFQTRLNFEANIAVCREVLARREKNLKILCVSSMSGSTPMPYFAIYSATKSALIGFYTSLRYEVKDAKITVLAPGGIPTREDVKRDIKIQGWTGRMSAKPAEFVVKKALKALDKNKRLVIPGAFNKFVYALEKFVPLSVKCRFVAKKWKGKEKDAF